MNAARARLKRGKASLIGGAAVAVASFILWTGVTHELGADTTLMLIAGLFVCGGIGLWIRMADL